MVGSACPTLFVYRKFIFRNKYDIGALVLHQLLYLVYTHHYRAIEEADPDAGLMASVSDLFLFYNQKYNYPI